MNADQEFGMTNRVGCVSRRTK